MLKEEAGSSACLRVKTYVPWLTFFEKAVAEGASNHCGNEVRQREIDRQTDRQTERQKDRKTERQKDRKTERQKDRKTERQKHRQTETQTVARK